MMVTPLKDSTLRVSTVLSAADNQMIGSGLMRNHQNGPAEITSQTIQPAVQEYENRSDASLMMPNGASTKNRSNSSATNKKRKEMLQSNQSNQQHYYHQH